MLDTLGGATLEKSWAVLRGGGRIATPSLAQAVEQFQAGQLQIVTDPVFPLEEVRMALEKLATGHACGKVFIRTRG